MLNETPSLSQIDLPPLADGQVDFRTHHHRYTLRGFRGECWQLCLADGSRRTVSHFLHNRGDFWVASAANEGTTVRSPDWRDAVRRVIT